MPHTGPVIKATRKQLKMSLRELAALADVDFGTISRIEREVTNPSPRTVKALTDALGQAIAERDAS